MGDGLLGLLDSREAKVLISHLDKRRKLYMGIFAMGFVAGYPIAEVIIEWLLDSDGYIPVGVEVIILQPLEVILLQLRIAAQIAFGMIIATVIIDLAWTGGRLFPEATSKLRRSPRGSEAVTVILMSAALGAIGLAYSHNVLIPFLLEYLAEDSAESGLQSTWQLQSWVGFVTGLYFSSVLGFQVPILAVLLIRSGLVESRAIVENRGAIWFAALFLGALISPPDPISLFLVGGPMLVLLEAALLYERYTNRRHP
ncbi:MAG: twin-arginine translocase subunit TatC [Candidatus Thalassarchaeaceae archaeon]|jgi:sec-independent protein translocase protein TatC|nr:twin-arginine translocase subunit TatC [Candidatus Thalassarchaeaceae archaeon]